MKRLILIVLGVILLSGNVAAKMITERDGGALIVKASTTEEAKQLFRDYSFEYDRYNARIPRIYFKRLPSDWTQTKDNAAKHRTLIRILLPLVMKVNEEILQEREKLTAIIKKFMQDEKLSAVETEFVEEMARKYDAATPAKGEGRIKILLIQLYKKIDAVPPSIMVSTAIIYTNWGTSRLATEANSLYKEEVWYTNQGLKPLDDADDNYRYRVFTDLEDSIRQHALRINSHIDYDYFRVVRQHQSHTGKSPSGTMLAAQMMHDSNFKNIAGMIDYTLSYYKLEYTDNFPQLVDYDKLQAPAE